MKNLIILLLAAAYTTSAQVSTDSELFIALKKNDSLIFDRGFNNCDLEAFEDLIAEDMEFYHDKGGITNSKEEFIRQFKRGICGNPVYRSRRVLIPSSLEVFLMYDNGEIYGAMQKGVHKFYEKPKGKPEIAGSTARFTHLWLLKEGKWMLKRVLSYDHQMK